MAALDFKAVGDLVGALGPTKDHRDKFGRTFLGSLLGQTIVLTGMMLVYVAAVVLLRQYFYDGLDDLLTEVGPAAFWSIMAAPLVCILLFSMLPTALRALRERRMKAAAIHGSAQFKSGYFRLHPYGEADRAEFKRLDGADTTVLTWLRSTNSSLLYLSGASGVGKSSLLAASVLPALRAEGWAVVETRLFGNPIEHLRNALLDADLLARRPAIETPVRELLERAAAARARSGGPPILLVIDQFEEFLVLHREEDRAAFAALLVDLFARPIKGLRLLLVFRSDYRPLVFKLNLPPLDAGRNWQELSPYGRGEAVVFLQSGGRELSASATDGLLDGLDRIEDAPGIYRPITLNMVGLVLERMGRTFEGDPARLIQSYLKACLTRGEARDFAKPLLARMITDAGTKEPRAESDLVALTGFEAWQVKAALAEMARQGLVRRLHGDAPVWEVSHDFLARTIGQLIGRLKPTPLQRVRPLAAPAVLVGWTALFVLAFPYWFTLQERASENALRAAGASLSTAEDGGTSVTYSGSLTDEALQNLRLHLERIDPTALSLMSVKIVSLEPLKGLTNLNSLNLSGARGITSLEPIKDLTKLTSLDLTSVDGVTSLEPIEGLTNLNSLNISFARGITSLEPLKGFTNLNSLNLSGARGVTSLEPIKGLTKLNSLNLSGARGITSLEPLNGLTKLNSLNISSVDGVTSLEPIKDLTNLNSLNLYYARGITSLEPIEDLTKLTSLNISGAHGITGLEPLKGLTKLNSLNLSFAPGITSLEPIKDLTNLNSLDISGARGITSLEPIKDLTNLNSLDLSLARGITSLEPIKDLTNLTSLNISFADGITSLEPLKGLTKLNSLNISGARGITSLEPIKGLTKLTSLNLSSVDGVTSLEPIKDLTNLTSLNLSDARGITSLAPLKGRGISIVGASSELRATMD